MRNEVIAKKKPEQRHFDSDGASFTEKKPFAKPKLKRHERLHQVARFGQASSVAGLQTVGVAS